MAAYRDEHPSLHRLIRYNGPFTLTSTYSLWRVLWIKLCFVSVHSKDYSSLYILTFPALRKDLFSSGECVNGANIFALRAF